jgi:23S rRNA (uracil1939-C5)-methyltransferase
VTEDLIVEIASLNASGDGVATGGGGQLTVPFTLPGERVRVRIGARRQMMATARVVEVLTPSPHRITPRCPHFGPLAEPGVGPCGGCAWQHIAYPEQLRLKTALVQRLMTAAVRGAPPVRPMMPSTSPDDPWGYRKKVHFVFGNVEPIPGADATTRTRRRANPRLVMGHYVRGTRRVIPIRECPVHDPRGNTLAFAFADAFVRARVVAADEQGGRRGPARSTSHGVLRSLVIRVGASTRELAATLVATSPNDRSLRTATRRAIETAIEPPTSLHINVHDTDDGYVFGRETRRLSGPSRMRDAVAGLSFVISPAAFFQTNVQAAEILTRLVLDAVPAGARVVDLYAGAGLFALPLAQRGHMVTAVEGNRVAVEDGEASARLNRIPPERCRFVSKPVEAALRSLRSADAVVLDPPRDGCSPEVIEHLFGTLMPDVGVYVSCNPEALARDLSLIVRHGYTIRSIQPVDMFPHTSHVETVVVLQRTDATSSRGRPDMNRSRRRTP